MFQTTTIGKEREFLEFSEDDGTTWAQFIIGRTMITPKMIFRKRYEMNLLYWLAVAKEKRTPRKY